ncbi:MAG TPA: signal peptidase II [Steroidobacteraceae bacterium]|jgi:signal peptidase II|nr:signal peptidase II [Steroidobacteraceae bacterium]
MVLTILFGCVGCDQATKLMVREHLAVGTTIYMLGGTVRLEHAENVGAFLSLGESLPETLRVLLLTVGGLILVIGVLFWELHGPRASLLQTSGAALISAGGLGNVLDRLSRAGQVTDFLNIGVGPVRTGIFNIADMALMLGLALLLVSFMRGAEGR